MEINISQVTCRYGKTKNFSLINNYMARERAFHCLNEQLLVLSITGDIICSTRSLERFGNKHLASDLPTRVKERIFP